MNHAATTSPGDLFAALDAGTSQVKCVALDPAGADRPGALRLIGSLAAQVNRPGPGTSEFDPAAILDAARRLLAELAAQARQEGRRVRVIGLTGQVGGIMLIDRQGRAVPPCLTWEDQRGQADAQAFHATFGRGNARPLGAVLPPGVAWLGPRLRWLAREHRATLDAAWKVLQLKDYLFFHLTGAAWSEGVSLIGLADVRAGRVWPEVLRFCGLAEARGRELMPEIHPPGEGLPMRPDVAAALGFDPADPPRIAIGTADMLAGFHGCAPELGEAVLLAGTAEVIGRTTPALAPDPARASDGLDPAAATPPGVVRLPLAPGVDIVYGSTTHGGASLAWLTRLLGPFDLAELATQAQRVSPGVEGLLFVPHLAGVRAPWWDARASGALLGLKPGHGRPEIFRGVLEGCAMATRQVLEATGPAQPPPRRVRVAGGTARIELWNQIRAATLGAELRVLDVGEASAAGAILLAGAPLDPDLPRRWAGGAAAATVAPDPELVRLYDVLFERFGRAVRDQLAAAERPGL